MMKEHNMNSSLEDLLDQLIVRAGQAQIVKMFRNSAQDADEKLRFFEKEIEEIKAAILAKQNTL